MATFQDAYKYIRERMNTQVSESHEKDAIKVDLTNSLDKSIYNIPLTLKTSVPGDWKMVQIQQGSTYKVINPIVSGENSWVVYNVFPDIASVRLSRAL